MQIIRRFDKEVQDLKLTPLIILRCLAAHTVTVLVPRIKRRPIVGMLTFTGSALRLWPLIYAPAIHICPLIRSTQPFISQRLLTDYKSLIRQSSVVACVRSNCL